MSKGEIYLEKSDEIVGLLGILSFVNTKWQLISDRIEEKYQIAMRSKNPGQVFIKETKVFLGALLQVGASLDRYGSVKIRIEELFPEEDSTAVLSLFFLAYIIKRGFDKHLNRLFYIRDDKMMWEEMLNWIKEIE